LAVARSAFLSLGFASFPVLVAHLVAAIGWQWAFSVVIAPTLLRCGLSVPGL
jgi:hypothetical protein